MDFLSSFLGRSGYLPHGYCFTWSPGILWSMVAADASIAAAYFSIPLALISFARKRADFGLNWIVVLFGTFIFACGITHVMDIWTIWRPDYGLQATTKIFTAAVSLVTAVALWPLIPKALRIPSLTELRGVIGSLEAEVARRRSVEENLLDVQQSLAVTLGSIGAGFVTTDRAGKVTRMNAIAEQVMGWTEGEAVGHGLFEVFRREDRAPEIASRNPVDVMIDEGGSIEVLHQFTAIARDGHRTAIEVRAAPILRDEVGVRGMVMVFRDMTRIVRAEADSKQLAAIVASSQDAIIGKTLDGIITSWNRAAEAMFGYTAAEAIGRSVRMLIPAERQAEEMGILFDLATDEGVPPFDTVRLTKDGRRLDISLTISPVRDDAGRLIGASKIARDVTAQRSAEAALRASESRLRFTLDAAQIGDWDLDLATGATHRSLQHDRCYGFEVAQEPWDVDIAMGYVHPDDRERVRHTLTIAADALEDWREEYRVVWPDGSVHWVAAHGSVRREGGAPTHMLGIVSDITEQKLAEAARLKALRLETENREIQQANRLKSEFLANMSHELRTPLNAIIGFADLLQSGAVPDDSPSRGDFLGHIGSSGRHLLQLVNDVLDLSKVEAGKFEFFPEPVDLAVLIVEVGDVLRAGIDAKNIHFTSDVDPLLSEVTIDLARMKQVLYNYLSNAIKFTPDGGTISIRARPLPDNRFGIEVADSGSGIAEADLPRLFNEFQQLDGGFNKQHQGTGLGLALVRRLMEAQGGTVGVRSELGVGSVFSIEMDRARPYVHGESEIGAASRAQRLLVIGNSAGQEQLIQALSKAGFVVDVASTSEQALQHALGNSYQAITLDLAMEGAAGLNILANLASHNTLGTRSSTGQTIIANATILRKPIDNVEVIEAISGLVQIGADRLRVMVIDDDLAARDLMQQTLAAIDIDTVCIADGASALAEMDRHRPDVIILDLMMPGLDGFEVLEALERHPDWRHIPVFIWTSMILSDLEFSRLGRSAQAILGKGDRVPTTMLDQLDPSRSHPDAKRDDDR
jgi:PAS domain S-box-containing protein